MFASTADKAWDIDILETTTIVARGTTTITANISTHLGFVSKMIMIAKDFGRFQIVELMKMN